MGRALNPNWAKIHRSYTVKEVADLFKRDKNTVRNWLKNGLAVCDSGYPILILGSALREFIRTKKTRRKQKCRPWEFYCMRCKKPQTPVENMADYEPQSATKGRLIALCPVCLTVMNKYASLSSLEKIKGKLEISLPTTQKQINKSNPPPLKL
ncbi:MAG: helix-turn-helix domain-containing protein [Candidatus Polarisedimenticolaceae bacterium]|nr:helix-turn-helix domain-containing protein [Candidatus Polarisedimenticolaceae bacterium]